MIYKYAPDGRIVAAYTEGPTSAPATVEAIGRARAMVTTSINTFAKTVEKQWEMFDLAVQHLSRVSLWGPPGIGKTFGACRLRNNGETLSITLSEDIVAQELMGHYIPRGNEFVWHDGPVTTAVRNGYNVVVNELGRASAAVKDMFLGVLDNPDVCKLTMPTGEVVKPSDGFKVIATSNSGPEELDPALADRFEAVIQVQGPHPELVAVFDQYLPGLGKAVMDSYATAEPISCRSALTMIILSKKGVSLEMAAQVAFGPKARVVAGLSKVATRSKK